MWPSLVAGLCGKKPSPARGSPARQSLAPLHTPSLSPAAPDLTHVTPTNLPQSRAHHLAHSPPTDLTSPPRIHVHRSQKWPRKVPHHHPAPHIFPWPRRRTNRQLTRPRSKIPHNRSARLLHGDDGVLPHARAPENEPSAQLYQVRSCGYVYMRREERLGLELTQGSATTGAVLGAEEEGEEMSVLARQGGAGVYDTTMLSNFKFFRRGENSS